MNKAFNIGDLVQSVSSGTIVKVTKDKGKEFAIFAGEVVIPTKGSFFKLGDKRNTWIKMFFVMYKPVSFKKIKII